MKYFIYKKAGNNNLYWNYDRATWVERKDASIYTEEQRRAIDKVEGSDGGNWAEVVAEPVKYGEQPRPIPVIMGDGHTKCNIEGHYWMKHIVQKHVPGNVVYIYNGDVFFSNTMYVYIKEPAWPQ